MKLKVMLKIASSSNSTKAYNAFVLRYENSTSKWNAYYQVYDGDGHFVRNECEATANTAKKAIARCLGNTTRNQVEKESELGIVKNLPILEKIINAGREYYRINQLPEFSCEYFRVFQENDVIIFETIGGDLGERPVISPAQLCWNIYDNVRPYEQKPCRDGVADFIAAL